MRPGDKDIAKEQFEQFMQRTAVTCPRGPAGLAIHSTNWSTHMIARPGTKSTQDKRRLEALPMTACAACNERMSWACRRSAIPRLAEALRKLDAQLQGLRHGRGLVQGQGPVPSGREKPEGPGRGHPAGDGAARAVDGGRAARATPGATARRHRPGVDWRSHSGCEARVSTPVRRELQREMARQGLFRAHYRRDAFRCHRRRLHARDGGRRVGAGDIRASVSARGAARRARRTRSGAAGDAQPAPPGAQA